MAKVKIEKRDAAAILRLNNGVINAISPELVDDLSAAVQQVKGEFRGMLLAGGDKFFCIGLDLPTLLKLERAAMADFWSRFNQVVLDLYTLPLPTVCAINGHATAGGTVFALTCDYRFASAGRTFMGLNEVKLGVPVPWLPDLILRQVVGDRAATEMTYHGGFLEPEQALKIGLVDEVFPPEELEERAVEKIANLVALPPYGFTTIKANRVEAIGSRYKEKSKIDAKSFLDCWFHPAVQELLSEAAQRF